MILLTKFINQLKKFKSDLKREKKITEKINVLFQKSIRLGLNNRIESIEEYINEGEYGIAFNEILYELYENNISFDSTYYNDVESLALLMALEESEYTFMKSLINNG